MGVDGLFKYVVEKQTETQADGGPPAFVDDPTPFKMQVLTVAGAASVNSMALCRCVRAKQRGWVAAESSLTGLSSPTGVLAKWIAYYGVSLTISQYVAYVLRGWCSIAQR